MELVNKTPAAARASIVQFEDAPDRYVVFTAKATFELQPRGAVQAVVDDPVPLFDKDEETPLGLLPRDDIPRLDDCFEVILIGEAHAPQGRPTPAMMVRLSVGDVAREIAVIGERIWMPDRRNTLPSPVPFVRMPMTHSRAFGGTCEVLIDEESPVDVSDPNNRYGKGFDPEPMARQLGKYLECPAPYPLFDGIRMLPNLEDPKRLIRGWTDTLPPTCWATAPLDTMHQVRRALREPPATPGEPPPMPYVDRRLWHRAHPDWVIDVPPAEAIVSMRGVTPEGEAAFRLPALRLLVDMVVGTETSSHELRPQVLVLLPSERRFYLVYRHTVAIPYREGEERSARLRTEQGWFSSPEKGRS
jgi:hypothetical protein